MNKCQHQGCEETNVTECFLPVQDETEEKKLEHYCTKHAREHGFCYLCGEFWGGVERFEFAVTYGGINGVCENCEIEVKSDFDDCYENNDCLEEAGLPLWDFDDLYR